MFVYNVSIMTRNIIWMEALKIFKNILIKRLMDLIKKEFKRFYNGNQQGFTPSLLKTKPAAEAQSLSIFKAVSFGNPFLITK